MTTAEGRQQFVVDRLISHGYHPFGAAAAVGNGCGESGVALDSTFTRVHADHASGGFLEWRDSSGAPRKSRLASFADTRGPGLRDDLGVQVDYLVWELGEYFKVLDAQMRNPGPRPIKNLTANFCWVFENPAPATAGLDNRIAHAEKAYATWHARQTTAPAPQEPVPVPAPRPPAIPTPPTPPWTPLPAPAPSAPPSVPAGNAGRQSAVLGQLLAIQESYAAEIAALEREKAEIDRAVTNFSGFLPASSSPIALPPPAPTGSPPVGLQVTPAPKPALASSTIWGALSAILGMVMTVGPTIVPALPPQWQTVAGGLLSGVGGLLAIYGRTKPEVQPIQGIFSSK